MSKFNDYVSTINVYGNLREKPTKINKPNKKHTVAFNLALNPPGKKPGDGKECTWFRVVCFDKKLGKRILKDLNKGDFVYVSGNLSHNSSGYTRKGEWHKVEETQIVARACELISSKYDDNYDYDSEEEQVIHLSKNDDDSEDKIDEKIIEKFTRVVKKNNESEEELVDDDVKNIFEEDEEDDEDGVDNDVEETEVPEDVEIVETEFKDAPF